MGWLGRPFLGCPARPRLTPATPTPPPCCLYPEETPMATTKLGSVQSWYATPAALYGTGAARCLHCDATIRLLTDGTWSHPLGRRLCRTA